MASANHANALITVGQLEFADGFDVEVVGGLAFVASGSSLRIIDVSVPTTPVQIGILATPAVDIEVVGNFVYIATSSAIVRVIDVMDPTTPVEIGSVNTMHQALGLDIVGSFAYVADNNGGLRVINISIPAAPVEVGSLVYDGATSVLGGARSVEVVGELAFVASGSSGLRVIDVSNPPSQSRSVSSLLLTARCMSRSSAPLPMWPTNSRAYE